MPRAGKRRVRAGRERRALVRLGDDSVCGGVWNVGDAITLSVAAYREREEEVQGRGRLERGKRGAGVYTRVSRFGQRPQSSAGVRRSRLGAKTD